MAEVGRDRVVRETAMVSDPGGEEGLLKARKRKNRFAVSREPASFPRNSRSSVDDAFDALDSGGAVTVEVQRDWRRIERKWRGSASLKMSGEDGLAHCTPIPSLVHGAATNVVIGR